MSARTNVGVIGRRRLRRKVAPRHSSAKRSLTPTFVRAENE